MRYTIEDHYDYLLLTLKVDKDVLTNKKPLDREEQETYILKVRAFD